MHIPLKTAQDKGKLNKREQDMETLCNAASLLFWCLSALLEGSLFKFYEGSNVTSGVQQAMC